MSPAYLQINPKGKVPTLLVDGAPLTENAVILNWLNDAYPDAKLLPMAETQLSRAHQMSDLVFVGSTLHPAVAHYAMPSRYVTENADPISVVRPAAGLALHHLLAKVEDRLETGPWWYGQTWSVVDAYLYWVWTRLTLIGFDAGPFPRLIAHAQLSEGRAAVQRARNAERDSIARLTHEGLYIRPG